MNSNLRRRMALLALLPVLAACAPTYPPLPSPAPTAAQPAATPAPSAAALLTQAEAARSVGDDDAAAAAAFALVQSYPTASEARRAHFVLAESYARRGRWPSAVVALEALLAQTTSDDLPQVRFWLARAYEASAKNDAAATAYADYRALGTPLVPYAAAREAAIRETLGQQEPAATLYEQVAATADLPPGERAAAFERAIALRKGLNQPAAALERYRGLLELAERPEYRSRILVEAADLADAQGQPAAALAWRREVVDRFPDYAVAANAATALLAQPNTIAPAAAARIFLATGRPAAALPLLDEAIAAAAGDDALELRRLRSRALVATGDAAAASAELDAIIAAAPDSNPGRQAQLDRIVRGPTADAIEAYQRFATVYGESEPPDARAPAALARAADLLAEQGDLEAAAQLRIDLGRRFPSSAPTPAALHAAGLYLFQQGRLQDARNTWQLLADHAAAPLDTVRARYWAGRAANALGDHAAAAAFWQQAAADGAESFYGTRAAEQCATEPACAPSATAPVSATLPITTATIAPADWRSLEDWVAATFTLPPYHVADQGFPKELVGSGPIVRAPLLEEIGLHAEAMAEWDAARAHDNPMRLLQIARLAHEGGVPAVALAAANQIADLAPNAAQPTALRRLRFPAPWPALVLRAATEQQVNPLLIYSLIRQESMFDPGARSSVGARGLAQVMPDTAAGIAAHLGLPDFRTEQLDSPAISVRFGAYYIAHQIATFDNTLAGLAAYNGGPGNASRWASQMNPATDPDLFVELIDYGETRTYVKLVYSFYGMYRLLYTQ